MVVHRVTVTAREGRAGLFDIDVQRGMKSIKSEEIGFANHGETKIRHLHMLFNAQLSRWAAPSKNDNCRQGCRRSL